MKIINFGGSYKETAECTENGPCTKRPVYCWGNLYFNVTLLCALTTCGIITKQRNPMKHFPTIVSLQTVSIHHFSGATERPAKWGCWVWGVQPPTLLREQKSLRISTTLFSEFLSSENFIQSFFLIFFSDFFSLCPEKWGCCSILSTPVPRPLHMHTTPHIHT